MTAGTLTVTGSGVNQSATLSAGGNWSKADLATGAYTLTMRYSDGGSESKTMSITGSQVAVAGFTYQQLGSISIMTATAGTLTVTGIGVNQSATLSTGGSWNKGDLLPGSYTVTMRYSDGRSESKTLSITNGQVAAVDFTYKSTAAVSSNMVRIQGGTFTMGSPASEANRLSNEVQHQVTVTSFYIGKYQVTQKEWQDLMGTTVQQQRDKADPSWRMRGEGDDYPMYYVNWYEAVEYCNARSRHEGLTPAYTVVSGTVTLNRSANGYRLPTEAEWEYACRAGTTTPYSSGSSVNNAGWYNNSGSTAHLVGTKQANPLGLYDMHGNVWEWCWDWFGPYSSGAQTDPMGVSSNVSAGAARVVRGGSWRDSGQILRSAFRGSYIPSGRDGDVGFRLLRPSL
jgi:formylglycine-generating enzyme required for sulfatase activity